MLESLPPRSRKDGGDGGYSYKDGPNARIKEENRVVRHIKQETDPIS